MTYLDLYVVGMLSRAEALIPTLPPLGSAVAAYARISDDSEGLALGTERQIEDAVTDAGRDGFEIPEGAVFTDDDISASTLSRKPRPGFERLVAYVLAGQVKTVYAYSNSRLTRRPMELEILIQLAQQYGLRIRTRASGDDDLNTADGRMTARIKASVDAAEAEKTSERVKRQKEQRLGKGLPPGSRHRTFGYDRTRPEGGGAYVWSVNEEEAAVVRDVFRRVTAGESINAVTKSLKASGLRTVSGRPWSYQATLRMLDSPIYAGLLSYKGEIAGKSNVPPIINENEFQAAQSRRARNASGWRTRSGLLSGIAHCGKCSAPMAKDRENYVCSRMAGGCGNVVIRHDWLDSPVLGWVTREMVIAPKMSSSVVPADDSQDKAATLEAKISEAQAAHAAGDLDLVDLIPILKGLRAELARVNEEATRVVEQEADNYWRSHTEFANSDLSGKRARIRQHVALIQVHPAGKRGSTVFDPDRFDLVTVKGSVVPGKVCVRVAAEMGWVEGKVGESNA